jgi:hypothetical protein
MRINHDDRPLPDGHRYYSLLLLPLLLLPLLLLPLLLLPLLLLPLLLLPLLLLPLLLLPLLLPRPLPLLLPLLLLLSRTRLSQHRSRPSGRLSLACAHSTQLDRPRRHVQETGDQPQSGREAQLLTILLTLTPPLTHLLIFVLLVHNVLVVPAPPVTTPTAASLAPRARRRPQQRLVTELDDGHAPHGALLVEPATQPDVLPS